MATQNQESRFTFAALWLRVVAWIFKLAGGLFAFIALFPLSAMIIRYPPLRDYPPYWVDFLFVAAMALLLIADDTTPIEHMKCAARKRER